MAEQATADGRPNDFKPADTLANRTFLGMLVAQFLAAFNDQAIQASAMFFALRTETLSQSQAIALLPILFYAPWAIFCTVAGWLADRFSKQFSLIFWKVVEVGITALTLLGFYLGAQGNPAGPWVVLSTVFLMGAQSAFFVPAKYGAMPEILKPGLLSRGNGILEALSFLAIILGTVAGGVLSFVFKGQETYIGWVVFALAVLGALASFMIRRMPAANPKAKFPKFIYGSLWDNLKTLVRSRPLRLALIGLVFFTFVVAFMRSTVYMLGESQNPRWDEQKTSLVVGFVALGIGLGSPLAGWLSGRKIELGLIPLGLIGMFLACVFAAFNLTNVGTLILCIILIGFATGFYLVPLYTLLQYRAPDTGKGTMIATSNFVNVIGAILASLIFFAVVWTAHRVGFAPELETTTVAEGKLDRLITVRGQTVGFVFENGQSFGVTEVKDKPYTSSRLWKDVTGQSVKSTDERASTVHVALAVRPDREVIASKYNQRGVTHYHLRPTGEPESQFYDNVRLPRFLFLGAGIMTLITLVMLNRQLPDLPWRMFTFLFSLLRPRVRVEGLGYLEPRGPVVLLFSRDGPGVRRAINSATDRLTHFLDGPPASATGAVEWLRRDELIAMPAEAPGSAERAKSIEFLGLLKKEVPALTAIYVDTAEAGDRHVEFTKPADLGDVEAAFRRPAE